MKELKHSAVKLLAIIVRQPTATALSVSKARSPQATLASVSHPITTTSVATAPLSLTSPKPVRASLPQPTTPLSNPQIDNPNEESLPSPQRRLVDISMPQKANTL